MLAIVQRLTAKRLPALQEKRIAAVGHRRGIETQHRARLETTARERATRHEHAPVERSDLRASARAALLVRLDEDEAVQHEFPRTGREVPRRKCDRIGNPRCA